MGTWLAMEKGKTRLGKFCYLFYSLSGMNETEE